LHHDDHQYAGAGYDLVSLTAHDMVTVRYCGLAAPCPPCPHRRAVVVIVRSDDGHKLFSSRRRRRAVAVATFVLVLRPSRGIHFGTPCYGSDVGNSVNLLPQTDLWLSCDGLVHDSPGY